MKGALFVVVVSVISFLYVKGYVYYIKVIAYYSVLLPSYQNTEGGTMQVA